MTVQNWEGDITNNSYPPALFSFNIFLNHEIILSLKHTLNDKGKVEGTKKEIAHESFDCW